MSAFNLRAMEIASFAAVVVSTAFFSWKGMVHTVLTPILVIPRLVYADNHGRINDTWSDRVKEVQEEDAGGKGWVLE